MKLIHIKSQTSVALPIFTSDLSHLNVLEKAEKQTPKKEARTSLHPKCSSRVVFIEAMCKITSSRVCEFQGAAAKKQAKKHKTEDIKQTDTAVEGEEKKVEEEEEIPQLVPIATPIKKPKLEVSTTHSCYSYILQLI